VSTSKDTVAYIEDQLGGLDIRTTRMFGEYAIYCDNKVVGFICDDTLFVKPSPVDPAVLEGTVLAPAYPGSKDYHSVPGDLLEDREWLHTAIQATADALPVPAPKKPKNPRPAAGGGGV
jgi:TfoX/Sxy family transcriptional regulator of competence genes